MAGAFLSSLADAALEAATAFVIERRSRAPGYVSQEFLDRQVGRMRRSVGRIEVGHAAALGTVSIGTITTGAFLGYLDYRLPEFKWREGRGHHAAWYDDFAQRPSMRATAPAQPAAPVG
jgi:hypothetical protein